MYLVFENRFAWNSKNYWTMSFENVKTTQCNFLISGFDCDSLTFHDTILFIPQD